MIWFRLFFEFFKIGLFTFGGGYAMIPLIKEAVLKYGWLSEDLFCDFIGVCESTPGPIAVNFATFVGASQKGFLGAVVATLGVIIAPFFIIVLISSILNHFMENKYVARFLKGLKPVIIALILSSGCILLFKALGYQSIKAFKFSFEALIIIISLYLISFIYKFIFKHSMNSIAFILISAGLGILVCSLFNMA